MKLINKYLAQAINVASNSLRLSSEKIEMVAILREMLLEAEYLDARLKIMKKITEFSRVAIRLSEINKYLLEDKVDFLRLTDIFKLHAQSLVKDLTIFIDENTLRGLNEAVKRVLAVENPSPDVPLPISSAALPEPPGAPIEQQSEKELNERNSVHYIFEEESSGNEMLFQNYEQAVMRPIKALDALLKRLPAGDVHPDEYIQFARVMKANAELSEKFGTEIIGSMHRIIGKSLVLLKNRELMPGREIIEALRACLIVIAALVRSKEVDISVYLNRAEEFGQKIKSLKV